MKLLQAEFVEVRAELEAANKLLEEEVRKPRELKKRFRGLTMATPRTAAGKKLHLT